MSPLRSWYILTFQRLKRFVKKLLGREVKPTWVVYGNCNAQAFTQFLHALTDVGERYEIVWGRSYNATEPLDLSQCERIWAQLDEGNPLIYPSHIPAISFPPCNSFLLWPMSTLDPLTSGEHSKFPYVDEVRRRAWTKWPRTYQPFDGIQVPVMPQVAAYHGLEWWSADSLYPFHGEKISAETYLQKFLTFRRSKMAMQGAKSA